MARYVDGLKFATHIWEAAAMHKGIKVSCLVPTCDHSAVFDPHCLWGLFERRRWDDHFPVAQRRFWCRPCSKIAGFHVKRARMVATLDEVTDKTLPFPAESDWRRFLSRHRG